MWFNSRNKDKHRHTRADKSPPEKQISEATIRIKMRLFSLAPVGGRKSKPSAADRDSVWQAQQQMVCWNAQLRCSIEANSRRHDSGVSVVTATGADARRWSGTVAQPRLTFACCLELNQNYDKNTALFLKKKKCFLFRRWLRLPQRSRPAAAELNNRLGSICEAGNWKWKFRCFPLKATVVHKYRVLLPGHLCKISSSEISCFASDWRPIVLWSLPRSHMTSDGFIFIYLFI